MAHKFVPRKGFKKDKDQPVPEASTAETPTPAGPTEEVAPSAPEPPPAEESAIDVEVNAPKSFPSPKSFPRGEARSAKDSILSKLPGKGAGPKSLPRFEPRKRPERRVPSGGSRGGIPAGYLALISIAVFLLVGGVAIFLLSQVPGFHSGMVVTAPTRLDWTFVDSRHSLEKPDPTKLLGYDSAKCRYDLYVPPDYNPSQAYPMVLFLSSDARPAGWSAWKKVCVKEKIIFASPAGAGDDVLRLQRWRIALDVLDEVRGKYKIDPDRTYIGGYWGGAREACRIAFTLPELFGGVVAVSGGDLMRDEAWLRYRARERLSLAWVTTDKDRAELAGLHNVLAKDMKIRSEVWPIEGQSRGMPSSDMLETIFAWLEAGKKERELVAAKYPESRFPDDPPSRSEWAGAYFAEAKKRLDNPADFLSGLSQLTVCSDRWPDTQAAGKAKRLRDEWRQKQQERPWGEEEQKEQAAYDLIFARKLTAYLTNFEQLDFGEITRIPWLNERRSDWEDQAKTRWQRISQLSPPGSDAQKEADKNLAAIIKGGAFTPPMPVATKK